MQVNFTTMTYDSLFINFSQGMTGFGTTLVSPTPISTSLTTAIPLFGGEVKAQIIGTNPSTPADVGVATTYRVTNSGTGIPVVGTAFLK